VAEIRRLKQLEEGTPSSNKQVATSERRGAGLFEAWNADRQRVRLQCAYPGVSSRWFFLLADALERIEAWRIDYNTSRPARPWVT
jgi:hypothetical protein